jgi:glutaredoxin
VTTVDEEIRIYWLPGCSNCVRLKEYVTSKGFTFTDVNLQEDAEAYEELEARGIRGVPVITRGERYAFGMDLGQVDDVLGTGDSDRPRLSPQELVERMTSVTAAALRFGHQLPPARYWDKVPGRDRSYLVLVNHVVGHVSRFVTVVEQPDLDFSDVAVYAAAGYQIPGKDYLEDELTLDSIVDRADRLVDSARRWLRSDADPDRIVEVFYGPQTVHQILESNTYSVVQHTRQLQAVIHYLGIDPDGPIGEAEYAGLSLPKALWDEV